MLSYPKIVEFWKKIEIRKSPPRLHTGKRALKRAIPTLKNLIIAKLEDKICFTESVTRVLGNNAIYHTHWTQSEPIWLTLGHKKPGTELRSIVLKRITLYSWTDKKSYRSDLKKLNVSVPPKQILIYVAHNEKREVTDHNVMASKRKILCCSSQKSPQRADKAS